MSTPARKEKEDTVIGCLLKNQDLLPSESGLTVEDFQYPANRVIFSVVESLEKDSTAIDLVTVSSRIRERYSEAKITNKDLITLAESVLITQNFPTYVNQLKSIKRTENAVSVGKEIELHAESGQLTNDMIFKMAEKLLSNISADTSKYEVSSSTIDSFYEYLSTREGKELFGFSFGPAFGFLDSATKGIQRGRTYRMGAPSNLGKTQMLYNVINSLIAQGAKVAFFSLENDRDFTITNLMANYMGVNSHAIEKGTAHPDGDYLGKLKDKLYIIDDTYELSEIFAHCLSLKPDVVLLDYIGLVSIKKFAESEVFTEYAKQVQRFVKKTQVGWLDLSNLPTDVDEDHMRTKGSFYGSSYLRNNADVGIHMMYYKPFYEYKKKMEDAPAHIQRMREDIAYRTRWNSVKGVSILVSKNRIGPAMVESDFTINFNEGARFKVIEPDQKEKFVNAI